MIQRPLDHQTEHKRKLMAPLQNKENQFFAGSFCKIDEFIQCNSPTQHQTETKALNTV